MPDSPQYVANREEIPKKKRWDIHAIYEIECKRIHEWLESKAYEHLGGSHSERVKTTALTYWGNTLIHDIKKFSQKRGKGDKVKEAQTGELGKTTPTSKEIIGWLLATLIATVIELAVLGVVIAFEFKGEGAFILLPFLPAIALAVGGWLAGTGLGKFIIWKRFSEEEEKNKKDLLAIYILLFVGIVIILAVTTLRAVASLSHGGSPFTAGLITIALGLIVVIPKAFHKYFKGAKAHYEHEMFFAQQFVSYRNHSEDLKDERWEKFYKSLISQKGVMKTPELNVITKESSKA